MRQLRAVRRNLVMCWRPSLELVWARARATYSLHKVEKVELGWLSPAYIISGYCLRQRCVKAGARGWGQEAWTLILGGT